MSGLGPIVRALLQAPPHDGKWHKISVKLRLPRKFNLFAYVEARPGYYADQK